MSSSKLPETFPVLCLAKIRKGATHAFEHLQKAYNVQPSARLPREHRKVVRYTLYRLYPMLYMYMYIYIITYIYIHTYIYILRLVMSIFHWVLHIQVEPRQWLWFVMWGNCPQMALFQLGWLIQFRYTVHMYIYIYILTHTHTYIYIYIHITHSHL